MDRTTGTVRARGILPNPNGRLTPGLFARVELTTGAQRETVLIADEAVGTAQGQRFVLVVSDGNVAEYRPVRLGPVVDGLRVVREGLAPGETIVLKGLVRPGMTIAPRVVAMGQEVTDGQAARMRASTAPDPQAATSDSQMAGQTSGEDRP